MGDMLSMEYSSAERPQAKGHALKPKPLGYLWFLQNSAEMEPLHFALAFAKEFRFFVGEIDKLGTLEIDIQSAA